jgi:hypothetical protein
MITGTSGAVTPEEEFVGPFANWTQLNCTHDGVTDASGCINTALSALSASNPVLWVPAGTYAVASTLNVTAPDGVSIIGADPATTQFKWTGSAGGTLVNYNAPAYARVNRITFNGNGTAAVAFGENSTANFDELIEYRDDVFENAAFGMQCGASTGGGCADPIVLRGKFLNNTTAGVFLGNQNALDLQCYSCTFTNNRNAMSNNETGYGLGGGFHAFNSLFQNSSNADIQTYNDTPMAIVGNYSTGSNYFVNMAGSTAAEANWVIANNTVVNTTQSPSIYVGSAGPILLLNNLIKSSGSGTPVAQVNGGMASGLLSVNNTFTTGTVSATGGCGSAVSTSNSGPCHEVGDTVNAGVTVPSVPTMPGTPPNNGPGGTGLRHIYEVGQACSTLETTAPSTCTGSFAFTTAGIQSAINQAGTDGTVKPVVHIKTGTVSITSTLTIPACPAAGCDVQIIGDGNGAGAGTGGTVLQAAAGLGSGYVFTLTGPSKATISDLYINGNGNTASGILITNADQVGARVFLVQDHVWGMTTGLWSDSLNNTLVEVHGPYQYNTDGFANGTSFKIAGGGANAGGSTNIFGGTTSGDYHTLTLTSDARAVVVGKWTDVGGHNTSGCDSANLTGSGTYSMAGGTGYIGQTAGCQTTGNLNVNSFTGTALLGPEDLFAANNGSPGMDKVIIGGTGNVLTTGITGNESSYYTNSSTGGTKAFLSPYYASNPGPVYNSLSENPSSFSCPGATCTLITNATNQLKNTLPTIPAANGAAVTDVLLNRVFVENPVTGIHIQH